MTPLKYGSFYDFQGGASEAPPQWAKIIEHSTVIILIFENLLIYEQLQY